MSTDRTKSGPTPRQQDQRRKHVAARRLLLAGTAPWPFRVAPAPQQGPRPARSQDQRLAAALRAGR